MPRRHQPFFRPHSGAGYLFSDSEHAVLLLVDKRARHRNRNVGCKDLDPVSSTRPEIPILVKSKTVGAAWPHLGKNFAIAQILLVDYVEDTNGFGRDNDAAFQLPNASQSLGPWMERDVILGIDRNALSNSLAPKSAMFQ